MTVLPGLTLAQNTMKVRYEFTSALAGFLLLFIFIAATPVFAQTDGGLGVTDAMRVADTGLTIGGDFLEDGVTIYGGALGSDAGSIFENGYLKASVDVSTTGGDLYIFWDTDDDATDFDAESTKIDVSTDPQFVSVPVPGGQSVGDGTIFIRFVYVTDGQIITFNSGDLSGSVVGEIEDYEINMVASSGPVTVLTETGGPYTTTIDHDGISDIEVVSNSISIFQAPVANTGDITIEGDAANDDSFVLDFSNGSPISGGELIVDGNGGTDDLTINDGLVTHATVTHVFGGLTDATVTSSVDGQVEYVSVESVDDNLDAVDRVFTFDGGAEILSLSDNGANDGVIDSSQGAATSFYVDATLNSITINAGTGNDVITLEEIDSAYTGSVAINGDDDNDELIVDFDSGDPIPDGGLTYDGGAGGGTNSDNLQLDGAGNFLTVTHAGTSTSAGSVTVSTQGTITYLGLETGIDDNLADADNRVFTMTAADEAATLADDGVGGNNVGRFTADTSPDVDFDVTGTATITLDGLAGDDTLDLYEIDSAYSATGGSIAVNGGDDDDELGVHFAPGDVIPGGGVTFDGGSAGTDLDNLILVDGGLQATVTHTTTGAEAGTVTAPDGTLSYSEVEAGILDDLQATARVFTSTLVNVLMAIDDFGGLADNYDVFTLTLSQAIVYRSDDTSNLTVNGGVGDDIIIVRDLDDNFSGTVFTNGNAGDDTFIVDWEGGVLSPLGGISTLAIDGGTQTASDQLRLLDGTVSTVHHLYTNANDGFTHVDGAANDLSYVGLEPIDDELVATTRTFTFSGLNDNIVLDSDFTTTTSRISTTTPTSEATEFDHTATTAVIVNGGAGDDDFNVEPSDDYTILANGMSEGTADTFRINSGSLGGDKKITVAEIDFENGTYSFAPGNFKDVTYTDMEIVTLRFSDPAAFAGQTYPGDHMYPLDGESGISIEPYFNWDIDKPNQGPSPSIPTGLKLQVSTTPAFAPGDIVFETENRELLALTSLHLGVGAEDHYITDADRMIHTTQDAGIPLLNDTQYYWRLTATLDSGDEFCQELAFTTVDDLVTTLDYPADDLTIYTLDFDFDWNVASPVQPDVYWRLELDNTTALAFVGDTPEALEGL